MITEPVIGSVEFKVSNVLKPWGVDPEEYYIDVEGKITVLVDDDDVPAGKMELVLIKLAEAYHVRGISYTCAWQLIVNGCWLSFGLSMHSMRMMIRRSNRWTVCGPSLVKPNGGLSRPDSQPPSRRAKFGRDRSRQSPPARCWLLV